MKCEANYPMVRGEAEPFRPHPQTPRQAAREAAFLRRGTPISHGIWLVALTAGLLIGSQRVLAQDAQHPSVFHLLGSSQNFGGDLVLLCPAGAEPELQNQKTGKVFPISDPELRAVAEKACHPAVSAAPESNVNIVNNTGGTIYVGFSPQSGSVITWGQSCGTPIGTGGLTVEIPVNTTCPAVVTDSIANPGSRFCAATSLPPVAPGMPPIGLDCSKAQQNNETLIEPNFTTGTGCYPTSQSNCIWYDISVIPANCTDADWSNNYCAGTGGASYNLPVSLSCSGEPTYTCQGPPFTSGNYAAAGYPSHCGNPVASCVPTSSTPAPNCDNAYFFPTPSPQPNAECLAGQTLTITFLPGP